MLNTVEYNLYKLIGKITKRYPELMVSYFRKKGITIGQTSRVFSDISTSESFLIEIGSNVTIASNVHFVTHDASIGKFVRNKTDLFGRIVIGDNCFIGAHSVLLYGCTIGDDCIVAAGSVVTKSFKEEGIIIGGNPAKRIGNVQDYINKNGAYAVNRIECNVSGGLKKYLDSNPNKIIEK